MAIPLQVARIERGASGWASVDCMGCGTALEIHQPDQEHPDRLLGTCEHCHGWVIADFPQDDDRGMIVLLPNGTFLLGLDAED